MIWKYVIGALAGGLAGLLFSRASRASSTVPPSRINPNELDLPKWRQDMLSCLRRHADEGTLYQWGGGHGWRDPEYGVDCSGLVCSCARESGIELYMTADMMLDQLPTVDAPLPGDLALYGKGDHAIHVRAVDEWFDAEGRAATIGAEGGGSKVNDPEEAERLGARVKRLPDHRADNFLGFRTLEGLVEEPSSRPSMWLGAG